MTRAYAWRTRWRRPWPRRRARSAWLAVAVSRATAALMEEHWRAQARIGAGVSAHSLAQWSRVNPHSLESRGRVAGLDGGAYPW